MDRVTVTPVTGSAAGMGDEERPFDVAALLATGVDRRPLVSAGKSGARLERVRLPDGQALVVKHVDPGCDWIMRATGDTGRLPDLWSCGALARVPATIDHTMIGVERDGGDGWVVVMRDASDAIFPDGRILSRSESQRIMAAASDLHAAFRGTRPPDGITPLAELYRLLSPSSTERLAADAAVPRLAARGWARFAELLPPEVLAGVERVHAAPEDLADRLIRRPCTLVHGDLKLANLGFLGDRVVVLDWGSLTTWAPAAVDYAWFLAVNSAAVDATLDDLLEDAHSTEGPHHDEEAMRLALLGALSQLGWEKALGATEHPDEAVRRRELAGLAWWTARAREGLEVWDGG